MTRNVLILPGDGIGPEVIEAAERVLLFLTRQFDLELHFEYGLIGGASIEEYGEPLHDDVLALAKTSDAILLGSVGGPQWDKLDRLMRPESGLLRLRKELELFANLRPARSYPELYAISPLKEKVLKGLDILIVRELVGGLYFGEPRGARENADKVVEAYNTMMYTASEVERVAEIAFKAAQERDGRLCSVDKANVLETSVLWRQTVEKVAEKYPDVQLSHMYVDNAAMQLVRDPKQFDVILTENMFGDILSDLASVLSGSIGLLASASLNESQAGLYEPCHGAAPDIAGSDNANPLAAILSIALMLRYSLDAPKVADLLETAIQDVLQQGYRTADIAAPQEDCITGTEMGERVLDATIKRVPVNSISSSEI